MSAYAGSLKASVLLGESVGSDTKAFLDAAADEYLDPASVLTIRDLIAYLKDGPSRDLGAGVLAFLFFTLSEGSLCLPLRGAAFEVLCARLLAAVPASQALIRRLAGLGASNVARHLAPLVSDSSGNAPLVFETHEHRLYFQRYFKAQQTIAGKIRRFLDKEAGQIDADEAQRAAAAIMGGPAEKGLRLSPDQARAVSSSLYSPLSVITGGPGTGKTFIVLTLLRIFLRLGIDPDQIRIAAPTGRAARRISESIDAGLGRIERPGAEDLKLSTVASGTIHSLIGFRGGPARHYAGNPLPARLVIIDEVSMVDVVLMAKLLDAVDPDQTRIIFLGDRNQLPSVDAGAVLSDLLRLFVPEGGVPVYTGEFVKYHSKVLPDFDPPVSLAAKDEASPMADSLWDRITLLRTHHRSAAAVVEAAEDVLSGLGRGLSSFVPIPVSDGMAQWPRTDGAYMVELTGDTDVASLVVSWRLRNFSPEHLLRDLSQTEYDPHNTELTGVLCEALGRLSQQQVLCVLRRGPRGVETINRALVRAVCRRMHQPVVDVFGGMPIMVLRNDSARRLFNGDTGIVVTFNDGIPRAAFPDQLDRVAVYPLDVLPAWETAYAMTVHKSQGSEFGEVLMVLPEDPDHRLLTGEIVYTGITRAKKSVTIAGSQEAMFRAGTVRAVRDTGRLSW